MPSKKKSRFKITRKDLRMHQVIFQKAGLPDGTLVVYNNDYKKLLEGYKKGNGIFCRCCDSVVSASTFEAHAGYAKRRKPYQNIRASNGASLEKLAVGLLKGREIPPEKRDNACNICRHGGELFCCKICPRAFHLECLKLTRIPIGEWSCLYCTTKVDKFVSSNANTSAGRGGAGSNIVQQNTEGPFRIINLWEGDVMTCALCSACDYSETDFDPRTVMICDQCEMGFHVSCLKKCEMADLKEKPEGKWFCGYYCQEVHDSLGRLLNCGELAIPKSLLDPAKKKLEEKKYDISPDLNMKWRLLKKGIPSSEAEPLLSKSVAIFHDCFGSIEAAGKDLIQQMVDGENSEIHECIGMHCAVLTANSIVVSTGIFRVFGREVAEVPLIATPKEHRGQGYCRVLLSCIVNILAMLNVEKMILPSVENSKSFWTKKFGFRKIGNQEFKRLKRTHYKLMTFEDTTMLERRVPTNEEVESKQFNPF